MLGYTGKRRVTLGVTLAQKRSINLGEAFDSYRFTEIDPSDLKTESASRDVEPLLPVEKKLIGISLGLGLGLLVVLLAFNHLFPVQL